MNGRAAIYLFTAALALAGVGCGDDDGGGGVDAGRDSGTADAMPGDAPADAGGDDGGDEDGGGDDGGDGDGGDGDGGVAQPVTVIHDFDGAMFQLAESVVLHGGRAYVSLAPTGQIAEVQADGTTDLSYGTVNVGAGEAYALGVAAEPDGDLFVAVSKITVASAIVTGVYRIPAGGGMADAAPFITNPMFGFVNDIAIDAEGSFYITDAMTGRIYKAPSIGGIATLWSDDALLLPAADPGPCGMRVAPFPIGVNGIHVDTDHVVVANTETASIVRIEIASDGTAGAATTIAMDCATLAGADGIAKEADGSWIVAVQGLNAVTRVLADGTREVLSMGPPLYGPASVDIGDFGGTTQAVIVNASFAEALTMMTPHPSLATIEL